MAQGYPKTIQNKNKKIKPWGSERVLFCRSCYSVTQSGPTLCNPMDWSTPGFPALHHLPKLAQTHVHLIGDAIQPSHPLSSPFPPALSLSQHQGLFQWVSSLHQVAKVLELQPRHQSFQCISGVDFLRVCLFYHCFHCFPISLKWSDGSRCHDLSFFECRVLSQLFYSPLSPSSIAHYCL